MTPSLPPDVSLPIVLHANGVRIFVNAVARLLYGHVTMLPPAMSLDALDDRLRINRDFDILLIDLHFGSSSALSRIRQYSARYPGIKIIVLTGLGGLHLAQQCMKAGAKGVITKASADTELRDAIATVHAGGVFVSPGLGSAVDMATPALASVCEQARQVLDRLRRGMSDKDIALELGLSVRGVQYHKTVLKRVLGLPPGPTDWSVV